MTNINYIALDVGVGVGVLVDVGIGNTQVPSTQGDP
jgi:hypothetical protein